LLWFYGLEEPKKPRKRDVGDGDKLLFRGGCGVANMAYGGCTMEERTNKYLPNFVFKVQICGPFMNCALKND